MPKTMNFSIYAGKKLDWVKPKKFEITTSNLKNTRNTFNLKEYFE